MLDRPPGQADAVHSLFAMGMLDLEATGRHLRVRFDDGEVEAALARVFGEDPRR
ncbi:MAG: hypothetical protein HYZ53_27930 [Planctomycetes bacterium]|nr:hypothetical protein [Planctomycetota bacterium]